jgi:hypothetical protein
MRLDEATYIVCMLIVYVLKNVGKISFEKKIQILYFISEISRSFEDTLYKMYICENKATVEYIAE